MFRRSNVPSSLMCSYKIVGRFGNVTRISSGRFPHLSIDEWAKSLPWTDLAHISRVRSEKSLFMSSYRLVMVVRVASSKSGRSTSAIKITNFFYRRTIQINFPKISPFYSACEKKNSKKELLFIFLIDPPIIWRRIGIKVLRAVVIFPTVNWWRS